MTTIQLNINKYAVSPISISVGTEKSYGFEKLSFSFSSEWRGLFKTVTFYPKRRQPVSIEGIEGGVEYDLPAEVTERAGYVLYVVSGYADGKRIYSVQGACEVLASNDELGVAPNAPTPSEIEQIREYARQAKEAAESAASGGGGGGGGTGKDGVGIKKIEKTSTVGNVDTYTITLTDGTKYTFTVTNGVDGDDGVSCTHKWNGTTLTVTSASGTSSANLKGDKGDKGDDYTLTEQDKSDIANLITADIETALDNIIALQEALMVGTTNEVLDDLHEYAQNIIAGGDT